MHDEYAARPRLTETLAVRVANLPVESLERTRFTRTGAAIDAVLDLDTELAGRARAISDALYPVIGATRDSRLRPRLVGLRRSVHGNRDPGVRELDASVLRALPAGVRAQIAEWSALRTERRRRVEELPAVLSDERAERDHALRAAAGEPALRAGLVSSSPSLHRRLSDWLDAGPARPPRRKLALRLARYLARIVAKTSPQATFTLSGIGRLSRDTVSDAEERLAWRSVLEIDERCADLVTAAVLRDSGTAAPLHVRLNPTAHQDGDRWVFLSARRGGEPASVRANPALRACLDLVGDRERYSLSELWSRLRRRTGLPHDRVVAYLERLRAVGLLEAVPPVPDQAPDHWYRLTEWLAGHPGIAGDARAGMRRVRRQLAETVVDDRPDRRASRAATVRSSLADTLEALGGSAENLPEGDPVHESALLTGAEPSLPVCRVRPLLPALAAVRRYSALFSPDLALRLACGHVVASRFGEGVRVPFVVFCRSVWEAMVAADTDGLGGEELRAHLAGPFMAEWPLERSGIDQLRALADLRRNARADQEAWPTGADGVRTLAPGVLERTAAGWPSWVCPPDSLACHLQFLSPSREDGAVAALNECTIGYGRGQSRIATLAEGYYGDHPTPVYRHRHVTLAETEAGLGSGLNRRAPATDHVIDLPGAVSARERRHRIQPAELEVVLDPETGLLQLFAPRLGTHVRPVHLGLLADFWLPASIRLLTRVFGEAVRPIYQAWSPFHPFDSWRAVPEGPGVTVVPRTHVGPLAVTRQTHYVRAAETPVRRVPGEDDAAHLTRLHSWRREQALPRRCFVRVLDAAWRSGEASAYDKSRKPLYVDFDNWYLVADLERRVTGEDDVLAFQEALPEPGEAPYHGDSRRVTEHVVEVSFDVDTAPHAQW
ncbi:lantibiotic dehydratase [Halostreptopolyspora alba]|uniref:Lantibiotic dehydratase N-terminal domain-containing protein n=1 Tax=Halostreptopolyspora alba TaxID=2487137 RepID=A0A3N0E8L6_9ACTN|nr:hypothetical protein EFW17_13215 [Nocardiopsaceae bacterium YIM 96095]